MNNQSVVSIYGDSIMRGTVIDAQHRYHSTVNGLLQNITKKFDIFFKNRAHFGITVKKGQQILEKDLAEGLKCDYALLEFGGNDCSFNWQNVSENPKLAHLPNTDPKEFEERLLVMTLQVKQSGATPILMTLPPLDAERHLDFISIGKDKKNILAWLEDVQMIYRFHELYSSAICRVAKATQSILVDVRAAFLSEHSLKPLVGNDGVHPTPAGYHLICKTFSDFFAKF